MIRGDANELLKQKYVWKLIDRRLDWFDDLFKWLDEGLIFDLSWFNLCTICNNCLFWI